MITNYHKYFQVKITSQHVAILLSNGTIEVYVTPSLSGVPLRERTIGGVGESESIIVSLSAYQL